MGREISSLFDSLRPISDLPLLVFMSVRTCVRAYIYKYIRHSGSQTTPRRGRRKRVGVPLQQYKLQTAIAALCLQMKYIYCCTLLLLHSSSTNPTSQHSIPTFKKSVVGTRVQSNLSERRVCAVFSPNPHVVAGTHNSYTKFYLSITSVL